MAKRRPTAAVRIRRPRHRILKMVARYGELTLGPNGTSATVSYPAEEQMYYVAEGKRNGALRRPEGVGEAG